MHGDQHRRSVRRKVHFPLSCKPINLRLGRIAADLAAKERYDHPESSLQRRCLQRHIPADVQREQPLPSRAPTVALAVLEVQLLHLLFELLVDAVVLLLQLLQLVHPLLHVSWQGVVKLLWVSSPFHQLLKRNVCCVYCFPLSSTRRTY